MTIGTGTIATLEHECHEPGSVATLAEATAAPRPKLSALSAWHVRCSPSSLKESRMISLSKLSISLFLGAATAVASGCGSDSPVNAIENRITCKDVCQRYADCFDGSYDVDACTDRSSKDSTASDEKDGKLKACDACMDEKACLSTVFNCGTDCGTFVP